jgi:hypothetical protein
MCPSKCQPLREEWVSSKFRKKGHKKEASQDQVVSSVTTWRSVATRAHFLPRRCTQHAWGRVTWAPARGPKVNSPYNWWRISSSREYPFHNHEATAAWTVPLCISIPFPDSLQVTQTHLLNTTCLYPLPVQVSSLSPLLWDLLFYSDCVELHLKSISTGTQRWMLRL